MEIEIEEENDFVYTGTDLFNECINDSSDRMVDSTPVATSGFGGLDESLDSDALITILKAVRFDMVKLGQIILPKYCSIDPSSLHYEMSECLCSDDSLAMIIPRNLGKSVYIQGIFPAWNALFMKHDYIVTFSDSQDKAEQQLVMTYDILANNPIISQFVTIIKRTKSRIEYLDARGERVIYKSLGVGQSARGFREEEKRPDVVFIDDVETTEGARSEVIRGKIQRWFHNDVLPLGNEGMRIFMIGTMIHEDALITRMIRKPLRVPPMRTLHRSILDDNGESRWPEKWTTEKLKLMREDAVDHGQVEAFDMERLSRMTSPENQMIRAQDIVYYNDEQIKESGNMKTIAVVDLGYKEGHDNDPTIITTAAKDGRGNMWIIDIVAVTDQRPANIIACIKKNDRLHHPSCTFIEDIGGQEYLIKDIEDNAYGGDYVRVMRISDASEDSSKFMRVKKFQRIARLEIPFRQKKILFPVYLPEIDRLITEINNFSMTGSKGHDDILDTLAYLDFLLDTGYSNNVTIEDMAGFDSGFL